MTAFVEFDDPELARRARRALIALGYRRVETHGPFPLADDDAYAPRGSFVLALLAFGAGVVGLAAAYGIQWYSNAVSYPLNIGGRPPPAAPAFVPATVE